MGDTVSRKDLQRLVGRLKHIAYCIPPANKFFARILAALRATPPTGTSIVDSPLLKDINWFTFFADSFNGIFLLPPKQKQVWLVECDSSLTGGGAYSKTYFYAQKYNQELISSNMHIAQLEAINLVYAV